MSKVSHSSILHLTHFPPSDTDGEAAVRYKLLQVNRHGRLRPDNKRRRYRWRGRRQRYRTRISVINNCIFCIMLTTTCILCGSRWLLSCAAVQYLKWFMVAFKIAFAGKSRLTSFRYIKIFVFKYQIMRFTVSTTFLRVIKTELRFNFILNPALYRF